MDKTAKDIRLEDIVEIILRRRWYIIIPFCLCIVMGFILMFVLPKYYQAETLVLVYPPKVPKNYVQPVMDWDVESRVEVFSRQILSRSNLEKIMKKFDMFSDQNDSIFETDKIAEMRKRVEINLIRRNSSKGFRSGADAYAFNITFEGKDPEKVMKVTNALASNFIDENIRFRETESIGTNLFLAGEINSIREELVAKEKELKEYREKYMGELPEQLGSNLNMLTTLQEQLKAKETNLLSAKNNLAMLKDQISQGSLLFGQGATVTSDGRIVSDFGQSISLEQARAILAYLETRYTQKHPDIVRIKKIISELEQNKENSKDSPDVSKYIPHSARMEIEQIKVNINTLNTDILKLKSQIREYERRIENTPRREQELLSLNRDYNNKKSTYDMLLNKKLETAMSVNMEKQQIGESFKILDAAVLPTDPVFPNMKKLFLLALVSGLSISFGLIFLIEYQDTSFRTPKDIESHLGIPVLASIPLIQDQKYIRRQKINQVFSVVSILFSFVLLLAFAVLSFVGVEETMTIINQFMST